MGRRAKKSKAAGAAGSVQANDLFWLASGDASDMQSRVRPRFSGWLQLFAGRQPLHANCPLLVYAYFLTISFIAKPTQCRAEPFLAA